MAHHRWNESGAPVKINKKILHTTGIKPLQIQLFGSTIIGRIKLNDERDNNRKRKQKWKVLLRAL